jgi:hypothetical protein
LENRNKIPNYEEIRKKTQSYFSNSELKKVNILSRKDTGFPLESYPGEILTEKKARINLKMLLFGIMIMGVTLTPNLLIIVSPPTAINRIQFTSPDSMISQTKPRFVCNCSR